MLKNKLNVKSFMSGLIIGSMLCTGVSIYASNGIKEAYFNNDIKIKNNGKDTGVSAVTIITDDNPNGSTYLPLRKTAELLGKGIEWDGNTNTANIVESSVSATTTPSSNPVIVATPSPSTSNNIKPIETSITDNMGHKIRAFIYNNKKYVTPRDYLDAFSSTTNYAEWDDVNHILSFKTPKGELKNVPIIYIDNRILIEYDYLTQNLLPLL